MDREQTVESRLADEVQGVARRYALAVCGDEGHADFEGAELTALVLMRNHINDRLEAKGPYITEPTRPDVLGSGA